MPEYFRNFKNSKTMMSLRLYLVKKLVSKEITVISNITITSDIVEYNTNVELVNVIVKKVSDRQSFVCSPPGTKSVW